MALDEVSKAKHDLVQPGKYVYLYSDDFPIGTKAIVSHIHDRLEGVISVRVQLATLPQNYIANLMDRYVTIEGMVPMVVYSQEWDLVKRG